MKFASLINKFSNLLDNYPRLCILLSGMLSALAYAPIFYMPAIFAIGIMVYYSAKAPNFKQAFKLGMYFGFGHFLVGLYWITLALFVFIEDFWWLVPLALFGIPAFMAIFIGLVSGVSNLFKKFKLFNFIFAVIWVAFELIRSVAFSGFPWNLLGYTLAGSNSLSQLASVTGIFGLSMIIAYAATLIKDILFNKPKSLKQLIAMSLHIISILLAMIIFGNVRLRQHPTTFLDVPIRLVQPSIDQSSKWDIDKLRDGLQRHIYLSKSNWSLPDDKSEPKILIWSETAFPGLINQYSPDFLSSEQILITGAISQTHHNRNILYHNSMNVINSSGQLLFEYFKVHLVPFGEYIPFSQYEIIEKIYGPTQLTPGNMGQQIQLNGLKIAPLICYEIIFPNQVKQMALNADVIINITNDAWYGNSSGPYQHFYHAKIRAIENGVPLLRVANNGISAIIDPLGRIITQTKLNQISYLDGYIPTKLNYQTMYSSYLQPFVLLFLMLILFAIEMLKLKWIKMDNF